MLRKISVLKNCRLGARDGHIGRVKDFYFDDRHWGVRYLVADTGAWLPSRKVLISPHAFGELRFEDAHTIAVNLTKDQIKESPSIRADEPVSRQYETQYYAYYGWPTYWQGSMLWGSAPYPGTFGPEVAFAQPHPEPSEPPTHLRSAEEVRGYRLHARDGEIGHVEDFFIDDHDWAIRYLVVDTVNWWPGKRVLVPPPWITNVDWHRSQVEVDLDRETIQESPAYDPHVLLARDYEERLFAHYRRHGYWHEHAEMR
jgi:hypothetical protein